MLSGQVCVLGPLRTPRPLLLLPLCPSRATGPAPPAPWPSPVAPPHRQLSHPDSPMDSMVNQ